MPPVLQRQGGLHSSIGSAWYFTDTRFNGWDLKYSNPLKPTHLLYNCFAFHLSIDSTGNIISCEVAEKHIKELNQKISTLATANSLLLSRYNPGESHSRPAPSLPPSRPGTGPPPPARPPKSDAVKKLAKPTPAARRTQSTASLPEKMPSMKSRNSSKEYEDIDGMDSMLDEDDYEIPVYVLPIGGSDILGRTIMWKIIVFMGLDSLIFGPFFTHVTHPVWKLHTQQG